MMIAGEKTDGTDSLLELRSRGGRELLEELADTCVALLGDELDCDELDHQLVVEVIINYRHCNRYRHFFYFNQGKVRGTFVLGPDTADLYRGYVEMMTDSPLVFTLKVPARFLAAKTQLVINSRPGASFELIKRFLAPLGREAGNSARNRRGQARTGHGKSRGMAGTATVPVPVSVPPQDQGVVASDH